METTGRYRMLVAFALVAAWGLSAQWVEVPSFMLHGGEIPVELQARLTEAMLGGFHALPVEDRMELWRFASGHPVFGGLGKQLLRASLALALLAALLAGAAGVRGIVRRRRAARYPKIEQVDDGRALREIRFLARQAAGIENLAIHRKPGFLDGLAFGARGREAIALGGQPGRFGDTWSDLHRAVALHELAHWANGDVRRQEWVRGLLVVLSGLAAVAFLGGLIVRDRALGQGFGQALLLLLVLTLAWCLWAGWVRARETEADWRVVSWGYGRALRDRLSLQQAFGSPTVPPKATSLTGWLGDRARQAGGMLPWRFHPSNHVRLAALHHGEGLFAIRSELTALSGFSLALLASRLGPMAMDALIPMGLLAAPFFHFPIFLPALILVFFGTATVFVAGLTSLLTGTLGNQVLRAALAKEAGGAPPPPPGGLLGAALLFASSLEVGLWAFLGMAPTDGRELLQILLGVCLVSLMVRLWMGFLALSSRRLLARSRGSERPEGTLFLLQAASACILSLLLWPLLLLRGLIMSAADPALLSRLLGSAVLPQEEELRALLFLAGVLWILSAAVAVLFGLLTYGVGRAVAGKGSECEACGRPHGQGPVLGKACPGCGEGLAPWAEFRMDRLTLPAEPVQEVDVCSS